MRGLALGLAVMVFLPGCGWLGNTFSWGDGDAVATAYRASVDAGEDKRDLTVTVAVASGVPLEEFRESARYRVTRYCLSNYGMSKAEWTMDAATGDWAVTRTETAAILQARCVGR